MSTVSVEVESALGPESAGLFMTAAEFDAIQDYDENYRYELIHGVLVVSPIPLPAESAPNDLLGHWLRSYKETHPNGSCLDDTLPQQYVRTSSGRRIADRVLWIGLGRIPNRRRDPPTIAAEFVSGSRRDRQRDYVDKRAEYIEAGIAEYWIIDRFERTLTVIRNTPDGLREEVVSEAAVYRPPLLPGFELPLAQLLAAADRYAEAELL